MGSSTSRGELLDEIGEAEGINLLINGAYEIYKKDQVIFYLGKGVRGALNAVRIYNLVELDIPYSEIVDFMQKKHISHFLLENRTVLISENDTKIFFEDSGNGELVVCQIIISTQPVFEERILKIPC